MKIAVELTVSQLRRLIKDEATILVSHADDPMSQPASLRKDVEDLVYLVGKLPK